MASATEAGDDPHDLGRFVAVQVEDYERALVEIRAGRKRSHWMWYAFPQVDRQGSSSMTRHDAIKSLDEAWAYLDHPMLGPRLVECDEAALGVEGWSATEVFGTPDDMKLRSCATLFAAVTPPDSLFARLLGRYFGGEPDRRTLALAEPPAEGRGGRQRTGFCAAKGAARGSGSVKLSGNL